MVFIFLKNTWERVLDIVFPPRISSLEKLTTSDLPIDSRISIEFPYPIVSLMPYRGVVRPLIHALKYDGSRKAAELCAGALSDFLAEEVADSTLFFGKKIIIVPVPLSKQRLHKRGFNQTERILKELLGMNGNDMTMRIDVLERIKDTLPQTALSRKERLKNVTGAFAVPTQYASVLKNSHVFLIDDVTTTGATLSEAARALKKVGAEVTAIAIARA